MAKALSIEDFADLGEDFDLYSATCLKIRPKEGKIVPFVMNRAQRYLNARAQDQDRTRGYVRIAGLKGRQQGFSTFVEGRAYWRTSYSKGYRTFILTHEDEATKNLFGMAKRYHENVPDFVRPTTKFDNANELDFAKLDSGYRVATAGGRNPGRSQTIQFFHGSEVAFWPNAETHARGVMSTVPTAPGTEIWIESTSDGPGNYFHALCMDALAGKNEFEFVFIPWWWQDEYTASVEGLTLSPDEDKLLSMYGGKDPHDGGPGLTAAHLAWRRMQVSKLGGEQAFRREYPNSIEEAFDAPSFDKLIPPEMVKAAQQREVKPTLVRPIWGVDAARFGDDESTLCKRQGNVVLEKCKSWAGQDTMKVSGAIVAEYKATPEDDRPSHIIVDAVGIGAGVADRLREVFDDEDWVYDRTNNPGGTKIVDVNFGEGPSEKDMYNKARDELWDAVLIWLSEGSAKLPADDEMLAQDLMTPQYWFLSSGKKQVEPKDKFKKRLKRSPDRGDALASTFYVRPQPRDAVKKRTKITGGLSGAGQGDWMG
jgi:hypothetical protein